MRIAKGATRIVFINRYFVVKFPALYSWEHFLRGLLANLQEKKFSKAGWQELCPVSAACPLGLWLIMPYAQPLNDSDWADFDYQSFVDRPDYRVPVENKRDSFGVLGDRAERSVGGNRIVAVDYGS